MATRKKQNDLVRFITNDDVEIVVQRIPEEYRQRLRDVFIKYRSRGVRVLGSVSTRGRRDINLTRSLPPRVSLRRFLCKGQSANDFGAPARGQWPPWAVRRFLLYDVLLHELGHLQLVDAKSTNWNRKYAGETLAQNFADEWREKLWTTTFDHPDPIHNPPTRDELSIIPLWERLDKDQRYHLVGLVLKAPYQNVPDFSIFGELENSQRRFLSSAMSYNWQ